MGDVEVVCRDALGAAAARTQHGSAALGVSHPQQQQACEAATANKRAVIVNEGSSQPRVEGSQPGHPRPGRDPSMRTCRGGSNGDAELDKRPLGPVVGQ